MREWGEAVRIGEAVRSGVGFEEAVVGVVDVGVGLLVLLAEGGGGMLLLLLVEDLDLECGGVLGVDTTFDGVGLLSSYGGIDGGDAALFCVSAVNNRVGDFFFRPMPFCFVGEEGAGEIGTFAALRLGLENDGTFPLLGEGVVAGTFPLLGEGVVAVATAVAEGGVPALLSTPSNKVKAS